VSIDKNRNEFLAVIWIALLAIIAISPEPLTITCCLVFGGCGLFLSRMPEQSAGYSLGGFALASTGALSVTLVNAWSGWSILATITIAVITMILTGLALIRSWNARMPVRYGLQINISTIFGPRQICGPTRIWKPRAWLGSRMISSISLRPIKTNVHVTEIDICPAAPATGTTIRAIRPEVFKQETDTRTTKIHAIELSIDYSLDGKHWFQLYNIPHASRYIAQMGQRISQDQPEYWETVVTGFIVEEAPEVLRKVVHHEGWSAATVRDQREDVAERLIEELRALAGKKGVNIDNIEILTVDIDAPETLRAARNTNVYGLEVAENQARVGSIHIGLHREILSQMRELLNDPEHQLSPEAIAAITRSQIRELSRTTSPSAGIEDVLEEILNPNTLRRNMTTVGHNPTPPNKRERDAA